MLHHIIASQMLLFSSDIVSKQIQLVYRRFALPSTDIAVVDQPLQVVFAGFCEQ